MCSIRYLLLIIIFQNIFSVILCDTLSAQRFSTVKTREGIEISENGKKVLFYRQQPDPLHDKYNRTGYVHPLYNLKGEIITEDFPVDHPYHHGIFWAWHQVILNNKQIAEGWTGDNIDWQNISVKTKKEKNKITLQSVVLWKWIQPGNTSKNIITENTSITVNGSTDKYRAIDFDIYLSPLLDSLKIGGADDIKGYGGFCLRLHLPADMKFISADSVVTPTEVAVTAGPWMDIIGSLGGDSLSKSGVAIFPDPSNPGTKQQWILRNQTSMQNVPYPGRMPMSLGKAGWRLRYRVIVHTDNLTNDELKKLYVEYTNKRGKGQMN